MTLDKITLPKIYLLLIDHPVAITSNPIKYETAIGNIVKITKIRNRIPGSIISFLSVLIVLKIFTELVLKRINKNRQG
tara:strand:+ start:73 stop:306 length:234 start_codon:yes stop_codon:yes gene_type:complete